MDILALTYNVNRYPVSQDLAALFARSAAPHIVAVGLQEATLRLYPYADLQVVGFWRAKLSCSLQAAFPAQPYVCRAMAVMSGVALFLFCRPALAVWDIRSAVCPVGPMLLPTKGATGISLRVGTAATFHNELHQHQHRSISLCIVNAHLTHGHTPTRRNADYHDVCARLVFVKEEQSSQSPEYESQTDEDSAQLLPSILEHNNGDSTRQKYEQEELSLFDHDYVVFMGDLNYRLEPTIDITTHDIYQHIDNGSRNMLFPLDQLRTLQLSTAVFPLFDEAPITFMPTYKVQIHNRSSQHTNLEHQPESSTIAPLTPNYYTIHSQLRNGHETEAILVDYDRHRTPGYTDRVLLFSPVFLRHTISKDNPLSKAAHIHYDSYMAHPEYTQSDHKPVSLSFHIGDSESDNIILSWTRTDLLRLQEYRIDPHWRKKLKRGMRNAQIAEYRSLIGLLTGLLILLVFVGCAIMALDRASQHMIP